jgi:hypothetical protein
VVPRVRPADVLIRTYIGSMGFTTQTDWVYAERETGERVRPSPLDVANPSRTTEDSGATVRLFMGESRDGSRLLLKEYSASAAPLAAAESSAYERLITIWRAQIAIGGGAAVGGRAAMAAGPPVSQLIGSMESGFAFDAPAFRDEWRANVKCAPPASGCSWLIFAWEGLRTAAGWPAAVTRAAAAEPPPGALARLAILFDGGADKAAARAADEAAARRAQFAFALARGMVGAVAAVHAAGVAHRGIGPACFGVSSLDERQASALRVRLDNFGFSLSVAQAADESALVRRAALARAEGGGGGVELPSGAELSALLESDDLRALGYSILEVLLAVAERACVAAPRADGAAVAAPRGQWLTQALGGAPPPPSASSPSPPPPLQPAGIEQATLRRLLEDVYSGDMVRFREYCAADPRWREAVEILDSSARGGRQEAALGAGWTLLAELVGDGSDAQVLRRCGGRDDGLCRARTLLESSEWLR